MFDVKITQNITYSRKFDTYQDACAWVREECARFPVQAVYAWEDGLPIEAVEMQEILAESQR